MVTRKEDAASIVGQLLAEEIDVKNKSQALKSGALVEMSEGENPTPEETQELIAEAEAPAEVVKTPETVETPETPEVPDAPENPVVAESETDESEIELFDVEKAEGGYGGYLVSDRGDGKPALPTKKNGKLDHRLMGAAWAALHGGYRGNKYEGKGKQEAVAKLTRLYKREGVEVPKSEGEEEEIEKAMGMGDAMLPYGGATSMRDAKKHKEAMNEMVDLMDTWNILSNVVWNIMDSSAVADKKGAVKNALDECKSMLAAKAMVEFSVTQPAPASIEKADNTENADAHPLQVAIDSLVAAVDNSLNIEGDTNSKLQFVQPSLQELGEAITDYVSKKSVVEPPAQNKNQDNLLDKITELIQPLSNSVRTLTEDVAVLKAGTASVKPEKPRIPQPRTFSPAQINRAEETKPVADQGKTPKLRAIIRKSVGGLQ